MATATRKMRFFLVGWKGVGKTALGKIALMVRRGFARTRKDSGHEKAHAGGCICDAALCFLPAESDGGK